MILDFCKNIVYNENRKDDFEPMIMMKKNNRLKHSVIAVLFLSTVLILCLSLAMACAASDKTDELLPFDDVSAKHPHYDAIVFCYENGIFRGTSETTFEPDASMTRATVVTVLANAEGMNLSHYLHTNYTDVADDKWYTPYVAWASQNRVVSGYGNGAFGPDDAITVEQAVQILYNYGGFLPDASASIDSYTDGTSVSGWARDAMRWALDNGIYTGINGELQPQKHASRALMAQLMCNFSAYRLRVGIYADILYSDSASDGVNLIRDVHFDDTMFASDSSTYHHDIAKFALAMVCTANTTAGGDVQASEDNLIRLRTAYDRFGFVDQKYIHYDKPLDSEEDLVAHSFAQKELTIDGEPCLLVTVICRGAGYGAEWVSNGYVGESGPHNGFMAAAENIRDNLRTYIAETASAYASSQIKILVSGFSRSAAVTNCLANLLSRDMSFDRNNIYAYAFAAPNVADVPDASVPVYNIINAHDPVPLIPMKQFGFGRNGHDIVLPYEQNQQEDAYYAEFEAYYSALTEQRETSAYVGFDRQYRAVNMFADLLGDWVGSRENYCLYYQSGIQDLFREGVDDDGAAEAIMGLLVYGRDTSDNPVLSTINVYLEFFRKYMDYTASDYTLQDDAAYFLENVGGLVASAHRQETYLSWMYTLTEEDILALDTQSLIE